MTDQTTRNLAREVAELMGWRFIEVHKKDRILYKVYRPDGTLVTGAINGFVRLWRKEQLHSHYPRYDQDLNACARDLTREGWIFSIKQWIEVGKPNSWLAEYYSNTRAHGVGHWGETPAIAWCEAFLALCKYIEAKGEGS